MDVLTQLRGHTGAEPGSSPWQVRWRPLPEAGLRLFCLPHAGGGATAYRLWATELAPSVEVVAIRLPGRECRFRERPLTRIAEVAPTLLHDLEPMLDRPYAWFGHSMGALIAFECCRLATRRGLPAPRCLAVSGRAAPHLPSREPPVHDAPTPRLLARLREMGGTPREILDDPAVLGSMLPLLRADFGVTETYHYRPAPPLDQPILAYGGSDDHFANPGEVRAWAQHTTSGCTVRILDGGHFFLHESAGTLLRQLGADLVPYLGRRQ
jgi:medium-chain acyl-[acyl-carrier-protein] hydrolase